MKLIKLASSLLTGVTLLTTVVPALADRIPIDLTNTKDTLAFCKAIKVNTEGFTSWSVAQSKSSSPLTVNTKKYSCTYGVIGGLKAKSNLNSSSSWDRN